MIKEIVKRISIDSLEVAEGISRSVDDCIADQVWEYLKNDSRLRDEDIDDITDDNEWWNDLLENLMNKLKI